MASAPKNETQNPNSTTTTTTTTITTPRTKPISLPPQDLIFTRATHLTRSELLKRRSRRLKHLSKCYRDHYWALMQELKFQYKKYYWKFGLSPFREDQPDIETGERKCAFSSSNIKGSRNVNVIEGSGDNVNSGYNRCLFVGCKFKAMALTSFCHLHVLSDSKQKLYKACNFVIKSAQAGPITCGKPILRSTVPSLCSVHFQKAQKHVTRALKKAGLNVSSSSRLAPKFHVVVTECVRQIQTKRRAAIKEK